MCAFITESSFFPHHEPHKPHRLRTGDTELCPTCQQQIQEAPFVSTAVVVRRAGKNAAEQAGGQMSGQAGGWGEGSFSHAPIIPHIHQNQPPHPHSQLAPLADGGSHSLFEMRFRYDNAAENDFLQTPTPPHTSTAPPILDSPGQASESPSRQLAMSLPSPCLDRDLQMLD